MWGLVNGEDIQQNFLVKEGPNIAIVMWGAPSCWKKNLHLQSLLYATKPAPVTELREAIEHECAQIPRELFHDVCYSIAWRCQQCLDQNGRQFENKQWKLMFTIIDVLSRLSWQMIKRYGASVFPCSTPATMSKYSVSPSGERTFTLVFL